MKAKIPTNNKSHMTDPFAAAKAFDAIAHDYDDWYKGNPLFKWELMALEKAVSLGKQSVEVGVGTGVFAAHLEISIGIDPAFNSLRIAKRRKIQVAQAIGERLPFKSQSLDQVIFILSLCFIRGKKAAIDEAHRVLRPGGRLVVGFISKESNWGQLYEEKAKKGHKIYRYASLMRPQDLCSLARRSGFIEQGWVSTLFLPPELEDRSRDKVLETMAPEAGFLVYIGERR